MVFKNLFAHDSTYLQKEINTFNEFKRWYAQLFLGTAYALGCQNTITPIYFIETVTMIK